MRGHSDIESLYIDPRSSTDKRTPEVFVMMPYGGAHDSFWENVIKPAIESAPLVPSRTDRSLVSGDILLDITHRISRSKILLADITSTRLSGNRGHRNDNVMYELGIAHALRDKTEVVVIRRDSHPLNFDLSTTLVHFVDESNADTARAQILRLLYGAFETQDRYKRTRADAAIASLDIFSRQLLLAPLSDCLRISGNFFRHHFQSGDFREYMRIHYASLFVQLGLAAIEPKQKSADTTTLSLTDLGHAVRQRLQTDDDPRFSMPPRPMINASSANLGDA